MSAHDLDHDPNGYERQLDDQEFDNLAAEVTRRVQALLAQGVGLPMAQFENHHMIGLLEVMVGRSKAQAVREWNLFWISRQLDNAEASVREQALKSGLTHLLDGR